MKDFSEPRNILKIVITTATLFHGIFVHQDFNSKTDFWNFFRAQPQAVRACATTAEHLLTASHTWLISNQHYNYI